MESTFQKIVRKSGFKPVECKCSQCKSQCRFPCLGTPEDMDKLIEAGYRDRLEYKDVNGITIISQKMNEKHTACTFFTEDGLCELHDIGLKPTVGKLSIHTTTRESLNIKKAPSILVLKEWA